jgi:hypothetical protein
MLAIRFDELLLVMADVVDVHPAKAEVDIVLDVGRMLVEIR